MPKTSYHISLKGYVGGWDFNRNDVDKTLENKTVVFYYDTTALGSNYAVNDQDFRYNVVKEFEQRGWRVESVYLGNPMHHEFSCK